MSKMAAKSVTRITQIFSFMPLMTLPIVFSGAVWAQTSDESAAIEEVVVTGIRSSLEQSLDTKRFANSVVDAITAEDIGKFPDRNVADSLTRIPGLAIFREFGEGEAVSIRGTAPGLSRTLLNGNSVSSAEFLSAPQRSFNYALLASSLISKVEVYKSPEAWIDEGSIGGTVILRTRRPLDQVPLSGSLTIEAGYNDQAEEVTPQGNGLISWKNEAENFGILASFVRQENTIRQEGVSIGGNERWELRRDIIVGDGTAFSDVRLPTVVENARFTQDRERTGYQFTAQFREGDLGWTFNYIGAEFDGNTFSSNQGFDFRAGWGLSSPENATPEETRIRSADVVDTPLGPALLGSTWAPSEVTLNNYQVPIPASQRYTDATPSVVNAKTETFDLNVEYDAEWFLVDVKMGFTKADGGNATSIFSRWNAIPNSYDTYRYDLRDPENISQAYTGTDTTRLEDFSVVNASWPSFNVGTDEERYGQMDFDIPVQLGPINAVKAGIKYRNRETSNTNGSVRVDDGDDDNSDLANGGGDQWHHTIANWPNPSEFAGDVTSSTGSGALVYREFDPDRYRAFFFDNFTIEQRINREQATAIDETTHAAYVQLNVEMEKFRGNFGLRYFRTQQDSLGQTNLNIALQQFNDPSVILEGVRDPENFESTVTDRSYSELLPSLNIAYDLKDDLLLRFAAARVVARPAFSDLRGFATYEVIIDENGPDEVAGTEDDVARVRDVNVSGGNPFLEPFKSNQFDLSLEWYFAKGSALSAAIFYKDFDAFIIRATAAETLPGFGEVSASRPRNGTGGATTGIEISYQHLFDSGFGVNANYTGIHTDDAFVELDGEQVPTDFPGASDTLFNISGFYENEMLSARLSYNYRSAFALGLERGLNDYIDDYGQWDINAAYHFTDDLSVNLGILNVTDEITNAYWGFEELPIRVTKNGRFAVLGLNYSF